MNLRTLTIRADASAAIGAGHVMRMLALAQAWQDRGGGVVFVTARVPDAIAARIAEEGFHHEVFEGATASREDQERLAGVARHYGSEWLVVDGYHFEASYQRALRHAGFKVLALDDYGHCDVWAADAVLNQNIFAPRLGYESEVKGCRFLLGTRFALLRRDFRQRGPSCSAEPTRAIRKLLVTLGGSDTHNASGTILGLLEHITDRPLEIRVVVGAMNRHQTQLQDLAARSPHEVEHVHDVRDMPSLYEWADGVISAGGSTCWEWMYYGLPAAVVIVADNQERIAQALAKQNLAILLGDEAGLSAPEASAALRRFLQQPGANRCPADPVLHVDGNGAARVCSLFTNGQRITIATARSGWLSAHIPRLTKAMEARGHHVSVVHQAEEIQEGDILFLLSFWSLVSTEVLRRHQHNLVVHESDLPEGRGWSPVTWKVLEGENEIPVTLFEGVPRTDAGPIYLQDKIRLEGHELIDEIRWQQAEATFRLCLKFVDEYPEIAGKARPQVGTPSYYARRAPRDSALHLQRSLADQFNLLRVVDNQEYPAFFYHHGHRYRVQIEKEKSR